jgi:hypothetical protein
MCLVPSWCMGGTGLGIVAELTHSFTKLGLCCLFWDAGDAANRVNLNISQTDGCPHILFVYLQYVLCSIIVNFAIIE